MVNFNATLIAQILNFLVLVIVLAKFDAEAVKAEYAAKLAEAKQEAQAIVDAARKTAQAAHDKIMADTKAEQDQVIATAKEAIALEQKKAMDEVRAQVINLSMIAASKIVEQKLGSEEDKQMASKIVDSIMK
mgnify:CR=1 FL=1